MERLNLKEVIFGGLSMGGFVAMRLAARRPDLVKSLILMETSAQAEPNTIKYKLLNTAVKLFGVKAVVKPVMNIMFSDKFLTDPKRVGELIEWTNELLNNKKSVVHAVSGVIKRKAVDSELQNILETIKNEFLGNSKGDNNKKSISTRSSILSHIRTEFSDKIGFVSSVVWISDDMISKLLNIPPYDDKIIARHWAEISNHKIKNSKQVTELKDLYDCEIRYEDKCIKELFDIFEMNNLTKENTFFILTADHGEEFGEHGGLGHELKLYNEMLSVPLIFVGKGSKRYNNFADSLVELKDIPQVILNQLFKHTSLQNKIFQKNMYCHNLYEEMVKIGSG